MRKKSLVLISFILFIILFLYGCSNNSYQPLQNIPNHQTTTTILGISTTTTIPITNLNKYHRVYFNESLTDSMYPTINKTSVGILIDDIDKENINVGEIILFQIPYEKIEDGDYYKEHNISNSLAHRIVKKDIDKEGIYYITKGDNNLLPDYFLFGLLGNIKVRPKDIEGIVIII